MALFILCLASIHEPCYDSHSHHLIISTTGSQKIWCVRRQGPHIEVGTATLSVLKCCQTVSPYVTPGTPGVLRFWDRNTELDTVLDTPLSKAHVGGEKQLPPLLCPPLSAFHSLYWQVCLLPTGLGMAHLLTSQTGLRRA